MTYACHCCAFTHPDLVRHIRYLQRECVPSTTPPMSMARTSVSPSPAPTPGHGSWGSWGTDGLDGATVPRWLKQYMLYEQHPDGHSRGRRNLVNPGELYSTASTHDNGSHGSFADLVRTGNVNVSNPQSGDTTIYTGKWLPDPVTTYTKIIVNCGEIFVPDKLSVNCTPMPDSLNPCEDLMGYTWLRVTVWFVWITALIGNLLVLVVTLCSKYKLTVPKFLMCNLSLADLCLGIYLLLLAAYDVRSRGAYYNYAIAWQYEGGCQAAGFLSTFAACLSIFTLTVITLERWYAISHAINITKRLRIRQASSIMACGWTYSVIMSALPLFGVGGYESTSICLPMRVKKPLDLGFVITLLMVTSLAFIIMFACYVDMFRQVRGNNTLAGRSDATIAKRMAMLVFTDFLCLFPIAFFGITAAAGAPLITITESKILLVFFFPLNSCANPFLYAIFTKQFKKDFFSLMGILGFFEEQAARYRGNVTAYPNSWSHSRNSLSHGNFVNRQPQFAPVTMSYERRVIRLNGLPQSDTRNFGGARKKDKCSSNKSSLLQGIYKIPFLNSVLDRFDDSRKSGSISETICTDITNTDAPSGLSSKRSSDARGHQMTELNETPYCKHLLSKADHCSGKDNCQVDIHSPKYKQKEQPIMLTEMTSLEYIHSDTLDNDSGSTAEVSTSSSESGSDDDDKDNSAFALRTLDRAPTKDKDGNLGYEAESLLNGTEPLPLENRSMFPGRQQNSFLH